MNRFYLNFLSLSISTLISLLVSATASAQSCPESQIKADLRRANLISPSIPYLPTTRYIPLPPLPSSRLFPPPRESSNLGERERSPLSNIPYRSYNISFNLSDSAQERLINCGEQSIQVLIAILQDKLVDANLRRQLPLFLLQIAEDDSILVDPFIQILQDSSDKKVIRLSALKALGKIENLDLNTLLIPLLQKDREIGSETIPYFQKQDEELDNTIESLISILQFEDQTAHNYSPYYASQVLGRIGDDSPQAIQALSNIITLTDAQISLKIYSALALGQINPESEIAVNFLTRLMEDESQTLKVRKDAGIALGIIQPINLKVLQFFKTALESQELDLYLKKDIEKAMIMLLFSIEEHKATMNPRQTANIISILNTMLNEHRRSPQFEDLTVDNLEITLYILQN